MFNTVEDLADSFSLCTTHAYSIYTCSDSLDESHIGHIKTEFQFSFYYLVFEFNVYLIPETQKSAFVCSLFCLTITLVAFLVDDIPSSFSKVRLTPSLFEL